MRLVESNQFDTIYHEHFSYFSLLSASKLFERQGLELFDVEELEVARRIAALLHPAARTPASQPISPRVEELADRERALGFDALEAHLSFSQQVHETKWRLLELLIDAAPRREADRRIRGSR